ncbi:putative mitochondrial glutamyl-tRNA synthetase [Dichotomopilus funicola]|uniref:Glutamate--tRNA ligase, mitochondrial n=1 Tax=Dichotomopilus funicola TaxID=1934379 RepID=A0AAN6V9P3_9PEZI|nr:putative mitochondrial glutamyl-tRNA synthetase [Dichotomopilus funicola]
MEKCRLLGRGRALLSSRRQLPSAPYFRRDHPPSHCQGQRRANSSQEHFYDTKPPLNPDGRRCRTRFAPSPTGYLHLGSLRTALYNYLLAKSTGGQFVLRLEDTDQTRIVSDAESRLYEDLKWAGLSWDEGPDTLGRGPYGPYRQSHRLPLYNMRASQLVREGKAYRCFCSPEALEEHKRIAHAAGQPTLYPGTCSHIPLEESDDRAHNGQPFAIRFRSAEEPVSLKDAVYKHFRKADPEDDFVIMKRDGFPTYHFANVVDDHEMYITHVIRGAEWLVSTPKHVELYNAFGWRPPVFAHLPLLVDSNRQKLSKRDNSASMEYYQKGHILPAALLNFAALLGWSSPGQSDVMVMHEMVKKFTLKFTKGDIIVSLSKLPFLQDKHLHLLTTKRPLYGVDKAVIHNDILSPIKDIISTLDKAKTAAKKAADSTTDTSIPDLGNLIKNPRFLEKAYLHNLGRFLTSIKLDLTNPAARFPPLVRKARYLFWDVPSTTLEQLLRNDALAPGIPLSDIQALPRALAILNDKIEAVNPLQWSELNLAELLKGLKTDERYLRCFAAAGEDNRKSLNYLPLRWALSGMEKGLPVSLTMEILGRKETLKRVKLARKVAEMVAAEVGSTGLGSSEKVGEEATSGGAW